MNKDSEPRSRLKVWRQCAVFATVAVAVSPVLFNDFANDDILLIETNGRIHDPTRWGEILSHPYWPPPFPQDLYRPLLTALHAVEYLLGGGSPVGYRVVSVLLLAVVAVALLRFLESRAGWIAALASVAIFAVHPVHVEALSLAVAQNEIIIGLLALASTSLYVRFRQQGDVPLGGWISLGAMYAGAALLKESGFLLPAFWLTADWLLLDIPERRVSWRGFAATATIGAAIFAVRAWILRDPVGTFAAPALEGLSLRDRALTMLTVVPQWVRLMTFPLHLRADYSPQEFIATHTVTALAIVGLLVLAGAGWFGWRSLGPLGRFGLAWIGVALLPVSNVLIPTGILISERSLFVPSIGLAMILADRFSSSGILRGSLARAALAIVLVLGLGRSYERFGIWRNEGVLTVRTVKDSPRSYRAQRDYGNTLYQVGLDAASTEAYQRAIQLAPPHEIWQIQNELAEKYAAEGHDSLSLQSLKASLQANPKQDRTHGEVVVTLLRLGDYADAHAAAQDAVDAGGSAVVYHELERIADSAAAVKAPAGSIRVELSSGVRVTP